MLLSLIYVQPLNTLKFTIFNNFLQFTYCLKAVTCVEMYGNQETCKYTHVKWIQTYKNKINDRAQAHLDVFLVELE